MEDKYRETFFRFATGFVLRRKIRVHRINLFLYAIHNVKESFDMLWHKDSQMFRSGRYLFLKAIGMRPPQNAQDYYACLISSFALQCLPREHQLYVYSSLVASLSRYFCDLSPKHKRTIHDVLLVVGVDIKMLYNNVDTTAVRFVPDEALFLYNVFGEEDILNAARRLRQNLDLLKANGIIGQDY